MGDIDGQAAPHRVTIDPKPIPIDLGLLLKEGKAPPGTEGEHVPVVVPWGIKGI